LLEKAVWDRIGEHDNCVRLFKAFWINDLCYMVMEKCNVSLMDCTKYELADVSRQMLVAIGHVHSCGVVHRDIKPDNLLFGGSDNRTVKLCDFGLAKFMPKRGLMRGVAGSAPYISPEMLSEAGYDGATDIWSLGVTVYLILYGEFPYMPEQCGTEEMKEAIRRNYPPPRFACSSGFREPAPAARKFAQMLLHRNPAARATIKDALNASFLQDVNYSTQSASSSKALSSAQRKTKQYTVSSDVADETDAVVSRVHLQETVDRLRQERISTHSGVHDSSTTTFTFKVCQECNVENASTCSGGSINNSLRSQFTSPKGMNDIQTLQDDGLRDNYNPISDPALTAQ